MMDDTAQRGEDEPQERTPWVRLQGVPRFIAVGLCIAAHLAMAFVVFRAFWFSVSLTPYKPDRTPWIDRLARLSETLSEGSLFFVVTIGVFLAFAAVGYFMRSRAVVKTGLTFASFTVLLAFFFSASAAGVQQDLNVAPDKPAQSAFASTPRPVAPPPQPPADPRGEVDAMTALTEDTITNAANGSARPTFTTTHVATCKTSEESATKYVVSGDDNADVLDAVLAAWDDAGYLKDRAMQEDIRYSESGSARLSARDKSSIDGTLTLTITGRCG